MKKPSLLIVVLVLVVAVNSELPELLHLTDNTSNDFSISASELRSACSISHQASVPLVPAELPDQSQTVLWLWPSPRLSQIVVKTDFLALYSILRT